MRTTVQGDAAGGWIVDIHDGDNHGVYSPEAATAEQAGALAEAEHAARRAPPVTQAQAAETTAGAETTE